MRARPATFATLLLLLLSAPAVAGEGETLALCEEPTAEEGEAAVILSRWMRSARIEVRRCDSGALPSRRLVFAAVPGGIVVRLETATAPREREVPWLDRTSAPMSRLRTKGALARFSVIVEALLAEDRLAVPVVPTVAATRPPTRQPPRKQPQKLTESPAAPPEPASVPAAPVASEPPRPRPTPEAPEAGAPIVDPPRSEPLPGPPPPPTPAPQPSPEASKRWAFGIDGGASYRLRSPYLSTWEFGGGLHYGPIALAVTYQPEADWDLEGRRIGINVLAFALGGRFVLLDLAGFELGASAAARLEWLILYRKDTLVPFNAVDFGVAGGAFAASRLGPTGAELRVEGLVMPTARLIEIPDGPSKRLNLFGLRVTLSLFWDVWRPT